MSTLITSRLGNEMASWEGGDLAHEMKCLCVPCQDCSAITSGISTDTRVPERCLGVGACSIAASWKFLAKSVPSCCVLPREAKKESRSWWSH